MPLIPLPLLLAAGGEKERFAPLRHRGRLLQAAGSFSKGDGVARPLIPPRDADNAPHCSVYCVWRAAFGFRTPPKQLPD